MLIYLNFLLDWDRGNVLACSSDYDFLHATIYGQKSLEQSKIQNIYMVGVCNVQITLLYIYMYIIGVTIQHRVQRSMNNKQTLCISVSLKIVFLVVEPAQVAEVQPALSIHKLLISECIISMKVKWGNASEVWDNASDIYELILVKSQINTKKSQCTWFKNPQKCFSQLIIETYWIKEWVTQYPF